MTLKKEVGNIPTFHYVAGVKLKTKVQGRGNCPRCAEEAQGGAKGGLEKGAARLPEKRGMVIREAEEVRIPDSRGCKET